MRIALFVSLVSVAVVACGPPASVDAGPSFDGGGGPPDEDGGAVLDDAGVVPGDAGAVVPDAGSSGSDGGVRMHGIEARVENTTCRLNGAPPATVPALQVERAFDDPVASDAATLVPLPGRREVVVVKKTGQVVALSIDDASAQPRTVVDLSSLVNAGAQGLLSGVLSEDGAALFVAYIPAGGTTSVVLSRFALTAGAATASGVVVLKTFTGVVDAARADASLLMRDGMLFVALGDAGDSSAAQDMNSPFGKVLRYDARDLSATMLTVPADGPFFGDPSTLGEIHVLGLARPRCTVDRAVGRIWCADVGGATDDELNVVVAGANFGWPHMEGSTCIDADVSCSDGTLTYPVSSSPRASCGLVVGPVVRSGRVAELQGLLPTADACGTSVTGGRSQNGYITTTGALASVGDGFAAFGEDEDGEVYVVDDLGGVLRFVRPAAATAPTFPVTLTQTGCYDDVPARQPAASLVPFDVRSPLWSDGALKQRYLALPGTTKIGFTTTGAWTFPDGAILVKEFLLDDDDTAATAPVPMETRFFIKRSSTEWEGYSYIWNRAGTEAYLLDGSELVSFPTTVGTTTSSHVHTYPGRGECLQCHNANAGRVLGLQTGRMNRNYDYDGFVENQLAAMSYVGLFDPALSAAPDALPRWADHLDTSAPIADRARGYLAGNCAHCHAPGGPPPVTVGIDLRYETSFNGTHTCDITPTFSVPITDAKIIDPGSSATSELFYRIARRGSQQMPPLATLLLDEVGEDVVQTWIDGLTGCP